MTFAERRKKMTDAYYDEIRIQHPAMFEQCVAVGVMVRDAIENRHLDPLEVAAMAERSSVLLVACALGIHISLPAEGNVNGPDRN